MKFFNYLVATALGSGYSPVAPGTAGSLLAVLIIYFLSPISGWVLSIAMLLLFFIGVYSSTALEKDLGKDPSKVVIDEVVGMGISLIFLPKNWMLFLAAFILFRLFDIFKPFPVNKMENLKSGWGIMMDDVVAGFYALAIVHLLHYYIF